MTRIMAMFYALASYTLALLTFLYTLLFVEGFLVPKTIDSGPLVPPGEGLAVDLLLLSLFAVQHSVMARAQFKRLWTQFVPPSIERSTYVLFTTLALALLCWQWRPMTSSVWRVEDPVIASAVVWISFIGWLVALLSTFLINHFELFGLQQVFSNMTGRAMPAPRLRTPLFYKFVRHPLYLGFIIAFWATPTMTLGHLLFAAVTTIYIMLGILLEERDLIEVFGDDYRRYRERVSMLFPWRRSA